MRLLIDTHTFIWFVQDDQRLSPVAKVYIEAATNEVFISIASLWEIAIKMSLNKLEMGATFEQLIPSQLVANRIEILPISVEHLKQIVQLPFHHRDPFDRIMIAQSLQEDVPIVSRDTQFDAYSVTRLWS